MKSGLFLALAVLLIALPSTAFGQAQMQGVVDGSPALVPATSGVADTQISGNRTVDIVGSTSNGSYGRVALAKGNSYRVDTSTTLNEAEFWMGFTGTQNLTFYVFDSPVEMGTYTEIHRSTKPVNGTGTADWVSSGALNVPLNAGMYYIIAVSWDGAMDYYYGVGDTEPTSFGAYVHGYATGTDPLPSTISSTVNDQAIYHQRITTDVPSTPMVDIKCNGGDAGVMVPTGTNAKLDFDILAGTAAGTPVDIWLVLISPFGPLCYNGTGPISGWNLGLGYAYFTGALADVNGTCLDRPVPLGGYKAHCGLDAVPNGSLDLGAIVLKDTVDFTVF